MKMLNKPEFYADLGAKVAEARNQRDEARAEFHASHFRKARSLESEHGRNLANTLYDAAYKEFRQVPKVEYFK